jgi:hypothetical protein
MFYLLRSIARLENSFVVVLQRRLVQQVVEAATAFIVFTAL